MTVKTWNDVAKRPDLVLGTQAVDVMIIRTRKYRTFITSATAERERLAQQATRTSTGSYPGTSEPRARTTNGATATSRGTGHCLRREERQERGTGQGRGARSRRDSAAPLRDLEDGLKRTNCRIDDERHRPSSSAC